MSRIGEQLRSGAVLALEREKLAACAGCILELVRAGYPADAVDYSGATILHMLCWSPTTVHVDLLVAIFEVLESGTGSVPAWPLERIQHLVERPDEGGLTCLHIAARTGGICQQDVVTLLMGRVTVEFAANYDPKLERRPPPATGSYLQLRGPHNRIPLEQRFLHFPVFRI